MRKGRGRKEKRYREGEKMSKWKVSLKRVCVREGEFGENGLEVEFEVWVFILICEGEKTAISTWTKLFVVAKASRVDEGGGGGGQAAAEAVEIEIT